MIQVLVINKMTLRQQQNKERGGFRISNLMMSPSSRPRTHHHYPPDYSSCWKKRYDLVMFLATASAIFLYHSFIIHRMAYTRSTTTTAVEEEKEGPPAQEIFKRKHVLLISSSSSLAQQDEQHDPFRLAREQSFGFFDDIPSHHWQRAQEIHAKAFPNFHQKPLFFVDMTKPQSQNQYQRRAAAVRDDNNDKEEPLTSLRTSNFNVLRLDESASQIINRYADASFNDEMAMKESSLWYAENFHVEFHCPLAQRIPSTAEADGPKWVCDPHRIAAQEKCLVYSVGSNGNVLFEKGIRQEIGSHCEIHTFDIRERNDKNVVFAKALSKHNATFHHWGIGTPQEAAVAAAEAATAAEQNQARGPRMKTLQQTIVELNHSHQTIDIFKIDCESCEWFQYTTWLHAMRVENVTIRQILVETHHIQDAAAARSFFMTLHDAGYVIFNKEPNYEAQASCVEFAFVLLSPEFFVNSTLYHTRGYTRYHETKKSNQVSSVSSI